MRQTSHKAWGNRKEKMRLWHLLHKALTETTSAQLIISSYSQPNSMLYPQGIDRNKTTRFSFSFKLFYTVWIVSVFYSSFLSHCSQISSKIAKSFTIITISFPVYLHHIRIPSYSSSPTFLHLQKVSDHHCIHSFYSSCWSKLYWYLLYLLSS